jgi:hypothetical protein
MGVFLTDLMYDARCIWPSDGQEWTTDWATLVTDWIMMAEEHARFAPERDPWAPETITRPSPRAMARTATRPTTRAVMQGTAHPTTRRTLRAMTRPVTNPAEFDPSYFNGLPLGMWEMTGDGVIHDWGGGYYDLNWKMTPADWDRLRGAFDALETLPYGPASRVASAMRIRAQHEGSLVYAVKLPSNRPPDAPPPTPRMLREPREAKAPTVEAASFVGSGTARPSSSELLKLDGRDAVALPRIDDDGKNAYAVVLRSSSRLELTRFDVATGAGNVVSTYRADSAVDLPSLGTAALNNFSARVERRLLCAQRPLYRGLSLPPCWRAGSPGRSRVRQSSHRWLPCRGSAWRRALSRRRAARQRRVARCVQPERWSYADARVGPETLRRRGGDHNGDIVTVR